MWKETTKQLDAFLANGPASRAATEWTDYPTVTALGRGNYVGDGIIQSVEVPGLGVRDGNTVLAVILNSDIRRRPRLCPPAEVRGGIIAPLISIFQYYQPS